MLDNGGYVMINLTGDNVYDQALTCLKFKGDKAILVYDGENVFFADTITLSGTNVVITKGGQTITISNANAVTKEGQISGGGGKLYTHNIDLTFLDGCDETRNITFRVISSSENAYDATSFKALFNVGPEGQDQTCGLFNNAIIEINEVDNSSWGIGDLSYNEGKDAFMFSGNIATTNYDVSNLTLQTITDNPVEM